MTPMDITPGARRNRRGFTLVELLVVIGIIGVLLSILLPALGTARENAKRSACLSNLHQLSLSAIMYANDNRGWFPARRLPAGASPGAWWPPQVWYYPPYTDERDKWLNYLPGYTVEQSSPVLYCPLSADMLHTQAGGWGVPYGGSTIYLFGYPYFANYPTTPTPGWPAWIAPWQPARRIHDSADLPIFGDITESYNINVPNPVFVYAAHCRSGSTQGSATTPKGVNFTFGDGSARWFPWNTDLVHSDLEVTIESGGGGSKSGFFAPRILQ